MHEAEMRYGSANVAGGIEPAAGPRAREWYNVHQPFSYYFYRLVPWFDVVVAVGVLGMVLAAVNYQRIPSLAAFLAMRITLKNLGLLVVFASAWAVLTFKWICRGTARPRLSGEIWKVCVGATVGSVPGLLFPTTSVSGAFGWRELGWFWAGAIVTLVAMRVLVRIAGNLAAPVLSPELQCVVVGSGPRAFRLSKALEASNEARYHIIGYVDRRGAYTHPEVASLGLLGTVERLSDILKTRVVDEALIALPVRSCYAEIQAAIRTCEEVGVRCRLPRDPFSYSIGRPRPLDNRGEEFIALDVVRRDGTLKIKRLVDLAGSVVGLVIALPAMVAIGIGIWITNGWPVIFRQERYGLNKRTFTMYKFRTMWPDAELRQEELEDRNEMSGPVFKIRDDPRITPVGRFLRRTSLDELPQLWNVLGGSMSLVGPRPLPARDVARFSDAWLMRRFSVKPGLTCLWQVSGRSRVDFDRWIELDLEYIDSWSLSLDMRILLRTVAAVIRGEGAA